MLKSDSIIKISVDLVKAQSEMSDPVKNVSNSFFKSKYADLSAVREACIVALNKNNICVLQPTTSHDGKNYVQTLLLHSSGEFIGCETEIKIKNAGDPKQANDPQAEGSGITYARRYGISSLLFLGAEDDDGNAASRNGHVKIETKNNNPDIKTENDKQAYAALDDCQTVTDIENVFNAWKTKVSNAGDFTRHKGNLKTLINGRK